MSAITDSPRNDPIEAGAAGPEMTLSPEPEREPVSACDLPHARLTACLRLVLIVVWTLPLAIIQAVILGCGGRTLSRRIARFFWQGVAGIMGVRVKVRGERPAAPPVLYVSNHISYLDIVVLGSTIDAAFVAKGEIASWPGFSVIAKLGRTVFVDRARRRQSAAQRDALRARLDAEQDSLILFPEGTSYDGSWVRPFKTSLFAAASSGAEGSETPVQPVTIAYTRLDGMPLGRGWRSLIAWYGDSAMAPHAWRLLGLGKITAEVEFHPPLLPSATRSRKELATECRAVIGAGLARANTGWR